MTPAWAQRKEELLSDCLVSPEVFNPMLDRLGDFAVPYQHALEAEAGQGHVHRYLQGLLSHVDHKNAEKIAALVDVDRQVIQLCTKSPVRNLTHRSMRTFWSLFDSFSRSKRPVFHTK